MYAGGGDKYREKDSTNTFFTSGSIKLIYGSISFGSVTKEHMFPTIWVAFFLVSALLSLRPRWTIGTNNASDGASIVSTNVVCNDGKRGRRGCQGLL